MGRTAVPSRAPASRRRRGPQNIPAYSSSVAGLRKLNGAFSAVRVRVGNRDTVGLCRPAPQLQVPLVARPRNQLSLLNVAILRVGGGRLQDVSNAGDACAMIQ